MDLLTQLKRDEGERASAYQDSLGYWTVGIGTCIDARKACGLTQEEMEMLANNRIEIARAKLREEYPWTATLDEVRLSALLNMAYEMGIDGLGQFRNMLGAMEQKLFGAAAHEMLDSLWARVQSPARAQRLAQQILTGVWI